MSSSDKLSSHCDNAIYICVLVTYNTHFDGGLGKKMSKLKCERIFLIKMCWYKNSAYVNVVRFISVTIVYLKS